MKIEDLSTDELKAASDQVAAIPPEQLYKMADVMRSVANMLEDAGKQTVSRRRLELLIQASELVQKAMAAMQGEALP